MLVKSVAVMPSTTGDPKDTTTLAFYFTKGNVEDSPTPDDGSMCNGFVGHFLLDQVAGGFGGSGVPHGLGYVLGNTVNRGAVLLQAYDVRTGGSPIAIDNPPGALEGAAVAQDIPREVSLCLSYHGDLAGVPESVPAGEAGPRGDTHPKARRRGRVYVGPFNHLALQDGGGLRPSNPTVNTILGAAGAMAAAVQAAAGDWRWVVYSRKGDQTYDVTAYLCDNEWDTQRRRGLRPTSRVDVAAPVWA